MPQRQPRHGLGLWASISLSVCWTTALPAPAFASASPVAPLEARLYQSPVFAEPLVPTGPTTASEDEALLQAVTRYARGPRATAFAPLIQFQKTHPHSPWAAALALNEGLTWYHHGYFDRAITSFQQACQRR